VPKEPPPKVIVVKQGGDHGCIITVILLIIAWPLAILYWLARMFVWALKTLIDWLTGGPWRRRGRGY
jgi:hypothetical protein